jgi:hypothetical protein
MVPDGILIVIAKILYLRREHEGLERHVCPKDSFGEPTGQAGLPTGQAGPSLVVRRPASSEGAARRR